MSAWSGSSGERGNKRRRAGGDVDKDSYVFVADKFWKSGNETDRYVGFSLMVHKSIGEPNKAPTAAQYTLPGQGYFVCNLPSYHCSSTPTCGCWIPASKRNTSIDRHLEEHGRIATAKAVARRSDFEMAASILASALAYTTLVGPDLRNGDTADMFRAPRAALQPRQSGSSFVSDAASASSAAASSSSSSSSRRRSNGGDAWDLDYEAEPGLQCKTTTNTRRGRKARTPRCSGRREEHHGTSTRHRMELTWIRRST